MTTDLHHTIEKNQPSQRVVAGTKSRLDKCLSGDRIGLLHVSSAFFKHFSLILTYGNYSSYFIKNITSGITSLDAIIEKG